MRKKLLFLFVLISNLTFSQFATNFNCNDCSGNKHNLFNELDSGYIIVLDWVMPCVSCIGPSKTAYNIIQSYSDSFPEKIRMYMCDDLADTYCPSLVSWTDNNGMPKAIKFSDNSIKMEDYGLPGMPKIVILGNKSHFVYFNEVDFEAGNITNLKNALNDALAGKAALNKIEKQNEQIFLSRNFSEKKYYLNLNLSNPETYNMKIYDLSGKVVSEKFLNIENKNTKIDLEIEDLTIGMYNVTVYNEKSLLNLKLIIYN